MLDLSCGSTGMVGPVSWPNTDQGRNLAPAPAGPAQTEASDTTGLAQLILEALADYDAYEQEDQDGLGIANPPADATTAECEVPAVQSVQVKTSDPSETNQPEAERRRNRGRARKHRAAARAAAAAGAPSTTAVVGAPVLASATDESEEGAARDADESRIVIASRGRT